MTYDVALFRHYNYGVAASRASYAEAPFALTLNIVHHEIGSATSHGQISPATAIVERAHLRAITSDSAPLQTPVKSGDMLTDSTAAPVPGEEPGTAASRPQEGPA